MTFYYPLNWYFYFLSSLFSLTAKDEFSHSSWEALQQLLFAISETLSLESQKKFAVGWTVERRRLNLRSLGAVKRRRRRISTNWDDIFEWLDGFWRGYLQQVGSKPSLLGHKFNHWTRKKGLHNASLSPNRKHWLCVINVLVNNIDNN